MQGNTGEKPRAQPEKLCSAHAVMSTAVRYRAVSSSCQRYRADKHSRVPAGDTALQRLGLCLSVPHCLVKVNGAKSVTYPRRDWDLTATPHIDQVERLPVVWLFPCFCAAAVLSLAMDLLPQVGRAKRLTSSE